MSDTVSSEYYRQRERQELRCAARAASPAIAALHAELARRYAALITESADTARRPVLTIRA
jgi:sarcosine oxidase gamma subunit